MAQNKKNQYVGKEEPKKKPYKNPASTHWGKAIICFLALAMLFSGLVSLIIIMIQRG